jgi:hypothetical protein
MTPVQPSKLRHQPRTMEVPEWFQSWYMREVPGFGAVSSAGRALRLHRRGRRFEPVTAHQPLDGT